MWWKAALGTGIVLLTLQQMFRDLFHPVQSGALSDWIGTRLFRILRFRASCLVSAGPLTIIVVIFLWATLLAVGFAFIYWAVFPADFSLHTANQPTPANGYWWSLYYSLEMLTTLGLGDIQPNTTWLRLLSASHTLVGFSFVTASLTWILLLYPALSRLRTLSRKALTFAEAEQATGVSMTGPGMDGPLFVIAEEVLRTRVDLVHFPILFFFYSSDPKSSLPKALLVLKEFADRGTELTADKHVRLASEALKRALQQLAETVASRIGMQQPGPIGVIFDAYADMHRARQ